MKLLFDHFDTLINAPDGIKKMRELILQLAVQGKLVPQDPKDEPASVLLKKVKSKKTLPEVKEEEKSYELPKGWEWVRLGSFGDWGSGSTPNRSNAAFYNGDISWIKSGELDKGIIYDSEEKVTEKALKETSLRLNKKGDVLIAMYGATIGKTAILGIEATTNQAVCACTCNNGIYNKYLLVLLKAWLGNFIQQGAGAAQPNISKQKIINTSTPLPPLNEQKRIVAKVDQLMALCDELEKQKEKAAKKRLALNQASLHHMLSAENQKTFTHYWQQITNHFDLFYSTPENVKALKQAILQLAVQGKLVPQDPNDDPASKMFEKILLAQKQLMKSNNETKRVHADENGKEKNKPFSIPTNWEWVYLGNVMEKMGAGSTPLGGSRVYQATGAMFLRSQNVWDEGLRLSNVAHISLDTHTKMSGTHICAGDVLLNITGASIGRCAIVPSDIKAANVSQHVAILRLIDKNIKEYLHICITSPFFQDTVMSEQVGVSREGLSMTKLKYFYFPLPPLNEQKRIVAKVDQLMALCDELEKSLTHASHKSQALLASIINQVGKR